MKRLIHARKLLNKSVGMFIIDPQYSFTKGSWMRYFGETEVNRIKGAFNNVAIVLKELEEYKDEIPIIFSRCYTYGNDYDFDDSVRELAEQYPWVHKPGNSIYYSPDFPKFRKFIENEVLGKNISTLIVGGCTLNSCVRVSSIHIKDYFKKRNLEVIVDLSLCGARDSNYYKTDESNEKFDGKSPVDHAILTMRKNGVTVVDKFSWFKEKGK